MTLRRGVRLPAGAASAVVVVVVVMMMMMVEAATAEDDLEQGKTIAMPRFPTLTIQHTPLFGIFGDPADEVKMVSCGESSELSNTVWQSPKYPEWQSKLPGLCTLTLTPPPDSCGLRVHFVDLQLSSTPSSYHYSCSHDAPSFKLQNNGSVTPALCSDLTGFEGILELDPKSTEPLVLVLQLDSHKDYRFRVNITTVSCSDVQPYESSNLCGIKNSPLIHDHSYEADVNKDSEEGKKEEEEKEEEEEEGAERDDKSRRQEWEMEEVEVEVKEEEEEEGVSQREPRRRKKGSRRKELMVKKLRKKSDVLSQALASGVEAGIVRTTNDDRLRRQPWRKSTRGVWPWMVTIKRRVMRNVGVPRTQKLDSTVTQSCTGVLLDQDNVLTSASCVLPADRTKTVRAEDLRAVVELQEPSFSSSAGHIKEQSNSHTVSRISFPLNYDATISSSNMAVLTLAEPVSFGRSVRPLCLQRQYSRFRHDKGFVSGYLKETRREKGNNRSSSSSSSSSSDTLVEADVRVLSRSECAGNLANLPYPTQLLQQTMTKQRLVCTRGLTPASPFCQLETGSLLVRQDRSNLHYLVGVMGDEGQCGLDFPNVFSEVPASSLFLNLALASSK